MEQKSVTRLKIRDVSKSFQNKSGKKELAIDHISFDVYDGEFLVLLGPGRCGKSVLLNVIAGLMEADDGKVVLDEEEVTGPNPEMGMVFQKTGLLPWLTVMDNVCFGPKHHWEDPKDYKERAQKYIDMVGLNGFEKSYPYQLSGGMKQRVGIARAYANEPKILIMDEPFGALDAQTRYSMEEEVQKIAQKDKRTVIFVTNNIEEALMLGDRIILFTTYPAKIKKIYEVNIPKPRDTMGHEFLMLRNEISDNTDLAL